MKPHPIEIFLLKERRPRVLLPLALLGAVLWLVPFVPRMMHANPFTVLSFDLFGIVGYGLLVLRLFVVSLYVTIGVTMFLVPYLVAMWAIVHGRDLTHEALFWWFTLPFSVLGVALWLRAISLTPKKEPNQPLEPTAPSGRGSP